jgi:hypothetical protein
VSEEKPCCANPKGIAKKLTLPSDGFQVGIFNLDNILKEVAELKLSDAKTIKAELLKKVAIYNYIPSGSESEYSAALFQEYKRQFGTSK